MKVRTKSIKVANAPCSWGVLEFDLEGEAIGYRKVLNEMSQTGYLGTELGDWGFMPTDPDVLAEELKTRELTLLGAFVPVDLSNPEAHMEGEKTALKTAKLLAVVAGETPFIVLSDDNAKHPVRRKNAGRISPEHGLSEAQWEHFTDGVHRIAKKIRNKTGLRTVFHHHCAGFVETPAEITQLLALTDSDLIGLCFDTGHYAYGGGDPVEGLMKFRSRIWHVHFKDHDPQINALARRENWDYFEAVQHGIFCELGRGDVDFPQIISALKQLEYYGWIVVEQDVLPGIGTPKESAKRNRDYLRRIGL